MQLLSSLYQPVNLWKKNNFIKSLYHAHTHNIQVNTHRQAPMHARTHAEMVIKFLIVLVNVS